MNWLDRYIEWTQESEAPLAYHQASALVTVAGAVERKVWFNQGIDFLYPNLFVTLVGPPASRKTAAIEKSMELLELVEGVNIAPTAITREALYQYMAKECGKQFEYKKGMFDHASLTVYADEWGNFIGQRDSQFITALIKLYDCKKLFKYFTKHHGRDTINNVFLNMLAGVQPDILPDILPRSAIGSGFTSRVVYTVEERARHDNPLPKFSEAIKEELIAGLNEINGVTGEFTFDSESGKWYNDWYMNKKSVPDNIKYDRKFLSYAHRKPQHLLKIALIHSLGRLNREYKHIIVEDLEFALGWLNGIETKMHTAYGSFGLSEYAALTQQIMQNIKERKNVAISDLMTSAHKDINKIELFRILDTLQLMGKISYDTTRARWLNH